MRDFDFRERCDRVLQKKDVAKQRCEEVPSALKQHYASTVYGLKAFGIADALCWVRNLETFPFPFLLLFLLPPSFLPPLA